MQAAVLAIGDEMTSGQRLDTNSQWLSQRLGELGLEVRLHATVGDHLAEIVDLLKLAIERTQVVLLTGGLGPTADDLTRDAMAQVLGVPLHEVPEALAHIEQLFAARGRPMPERNRLQALLPAGSRMILNPHGTAPGVHATTQARVGHDCHLFALPGVPAEMFEMWHHSVAPTLEALIPRRDVLRHRVIKLFGVGESQLEAMLPEMIARDRSPLVGITASMATLSLRITSIAPDEATCAAELEATASEIYEVAGKYVFGEGEQDLDHALLLLLERHGATLATYESFSGGLLATSLRGVDAEAKIFLGGVVGGSVDPLPPLERAREIRERMQSTFGLAVGPAGNGVVEVAWHDATRGKSIEVQRGGHPVVEGPRVAKSALNLLRHHLVKHNPG